MHIVLHMSVNSKYNTDIHTKRKVVIRVVIELSPIDNFRVVRVVPVTTAFFTTQDDMPNLLS